MIKERITGGDWLEKLIWKLKEVLLHLLPEFIFWGRADRNEMKSLMKGCDLFVIPSRQEPFGIVALEAFAAGKKIVASKTGGLAEIVQDGINGYFVEAEDTEDLARVIKRALSDNSRNVRMDLSKNSWGKVSLKYLKIFGKRK